MIQDLAIGYQEKIPVEDLALVFGPCTQFERDVIIDRLVDDFGESPNALDNNGVWMPNTSDGVNLGHGEVYGKSYDIHVSIETYKVRGQWIAFVIVIPSMYVHALLEEWMKTCFPCKDNQGNPAIYCPNYFDQALAYINWKASEPAPPEVLRFRNPLPIKGWSSTMSSGVELKLVAFINMDASYRLVIAQQIDGPRDEMYSPYLYWIYDRSLGETPDDKDMLEFARVPNSYGKHGQVTLNEVKNLVRQRFALLRPTLANSIRRYEWNSSESMSL